MDIEANCVGVSCIGQFFLFCFWLFCTPPVNATTFVIYSHSASKTRACRWQPSCRWRNSAIFDPCRWRVCPVNDKGGGNLNIQFLLFPPLLGIKVHILTKKYLQSNVSYICRQYLQKPPFCCKHSLPMCLPTGLVHPHRLETIFWS